MPSALSRLRSMLSGPPAPPAAPLAPAAGPVEPPAPAAPVPPQEPAPSWLAPLLATHTGYKGSVAWCLRRDGIWIEGEPPVGSGGEPLSVRAALRQYGDLMQKEATRHGVPFELVVACACAETAPWIRQGTADSARREEPGFVTDESTPGRVSVGVMQTLLSTARMTLKLGSLGTADLRKPAVSIAAGVGYMASQFRMTGFDPPKVGAAYNAGGVYLDQAERNRWRMRCYPLGTGEHVDKFVRFFNDAMAVCAADPQAAGEAPSFVRWLSA